MVITSWISIGAFYLIERTTASAPGKIILTGEHFVVHGAYSIAAAINRRVSVSITETSEDSYAASGKRKSELNKNDGQFVLTKTILRGIFEEKKLKKGLAVSISSDIPSGSGLGSSAAVSVATAAAALKFAGLDATAKKIYETALLGEKKVHINPSGIDVEASLQGGMIFFSKSSGAKPIPLDRALQLLVVYSGKPRKTSTLIQKVALRKKQFPHFFDILTSAASFLSLEMVDAITAGDLPRLGALMNISQTTLDWIGASNSLLGTLIEEIAAQEVFGVKLTGAGGGGSIIALPKPSGIEALSKFTSKNHLWSFLTPIPQDGLRWEQ